MSRFIGEPEDFRPVGEPRPVVVANDLLDSLGVIDCGRAEQERTVRRWLSDNTPHKVLAASLRRAGFLGGNVSNKLSNEPRRMSPDGAGSAEGATAENPDDSGLRRTRRRRPGRDSSVS